MIIINLIYFFQINDSDKISAAELLPHIIKNKKEKDWIDQLLAKKKSRQLYNDLSQPLKFTNITLKFFSLNITSHL